MKNKATISIFALWVWCTTLGFGSELNRAVFEGEVFMERSGAKVPYTLTIAYAPGIGGDYRNIKSIKLIVDGRELSVPQEAFSDLRMVHRPWPIYGVGGNPNHVQFFLEGGDASGSYRVTFEFDEDRLIQRSVLKHLEKISEVTNYPSRKKDAEHDGGGQPATRPESK